MATVNPRGRRSALAQQCRTQLSRTPCRKDAKETAITIGNIYVLVQVSALLKLDFSPDDEGLKDLLLSAERVDCLGSKTPPFEQRR